MDKFREIKEKHGGIVVLTFHIGNWEIGARFLSEKGFPVSAVYQPYENKRMKKVIEKRRTRRVTFIPVGSQAARGVRDALRRKECVAMLGDHLFGEKGTWVNLLHQKVRWPKGPILLAAKEGAPIVVAVVVRSNAATYQVHMEDPLFPTKSKNGIQQTTQAVADKFGKYVKQYPSQWFRFHPFEYYPGSNEKLNGGGNNLIKRTNG